MKMLICLYDIYYIDDSMPQEQQILVKVDKSTKNEMKKMNINWSAEIRKFIGSVLEKRRNRALAVSISDRIFSSQRSRRTDTSLVVRKFRDERYGANSG